MMKAVLSILIVLLNFAGGYVQQAKLVKSGKIQFNKTINLYAIAKKTVSKESDLEFYKSRHAQFFTTQSFLSFNGNQSLFTPQPGEGSNGVLIYGNVPFPYADQRNRVYNDFSTGTTVTQKDLLGETYLVKDSISKIKWKITDEFRDIAGYHCRRANALIFDSVYVVAFYTNEIKSSGGPESFTGLPGMILQVALPHENVSWQAVIVTDVDAQLEKMDIPAKGKIVDKKALAEKAKTSLKSLSSKLGAVMWNELML